MFEKLPNYSSESQMGHYIFYCQSLEQIKMILKEYSRIWSCLWKNPIQLTISIHYECWTVVLVLHRFHILIVTLKKVYIGDRRHRVTASIFTHTAENPFSSCVFTLSVFLFFQFIFSREDFVVSHDSIIFVWQNFSICRNIPQKKY